MALDCEIFQEQLECRFIFLCMWCLKPSEYLDEILTCKSKVVDKACGNKVMALNIDKLVAVLHIVTVL